MEILYPRREPNSDYEVIQHVASLYTDCDIPKPGRKIKEARIQRWSR
jgi:hypothetical protein